jgi:hypothetical protein
MTAATARPPADRTERRILQLPTSSQKKQTNPDVADLRRSVTVQPERLFTFQCQEHKGLKVGK